jgi:hypothetical protein
MFLPYCQRPCFTTTTNYNKSSTDQSQATLFFTFRQLVFLPTFPADARSPGLSWLLFHLFVSRFLLELEFSLTLITQGRLISFFTFNYISLEFDLWLS